MPLALLFFRFLHDTLAQPASILMELNGACCVCRRIRRARRDRQGRTLPLTRPTMMTTLCGELGCVSSLFRRRTFSAVQAAAASFGHWLEALE
jgi:hypothetical protein